MKLKCILLTVCLLFFIVPVNADESIIYPTEDSMTSIAYPDTNFGGQKLGIWGPAEYTGYSFLKFDVPVNTVSGTLNFYVPTADVLGPGYIVYLCEPVSSSWTEYGITWNNQPECGASFQNYTMESDWPIGWHQVNISDFLSTKIGITSIRLYGTYDVYVDIDISSREDENKPYIQLNTSLEDTNTIIVSETTDYNIPITQTNNSYVYLTTWVNDSIWSFWSPLAMKVEVTPPTSTIKSIGSVWGQNAYQINYDFPEGEYGDYQFKLKNCFIVCFPENTLADTNVTYLSPADAPSTIKFVRIGNNLSFDYFVNPYIYDLANMDYITTYYILNNPDENPSTPHLLRAWYEPDYYNGSEALDYYIALNNYFDGNTVSIHAYIYEFETIIAEDIIYYEYSLIPVPTLTPIPTPIPTPTETYTPIPTVQPTPDPENFTQFNGTGLENTTAYMGDVVNNSLGNINTYSTEANAQISSYDYSTHKGVLGIFLPTILNMFPTKVWGLIILGLSLELVLIILKR